MGQWLGTKYTWVQGMPGAHTTLQDRFRGAFLGMAVGDALGFPLRGVPPESLARLELGEDFAPRPRGRFA